MLAPLDLSGPVFCCEKCRLPTPTKPAACCSSTATFGTRRDRTVAIHLVNAMFNGERLDADLRSDLQAAITVDGMAFLNHPLWLTVTDEKPHLAVLKRTVDVAGLQWNSVYSPCGYATVDEFRSELRSWVAWYSCPRVELDVRDRAAVERAERLCGVLASATDETVPNDRSGSDSDSEPDEGDDDTEAVTYVQAVTGVTNTERIRNVLANTCDDVVANGLFANQHLEGIPKGDTCRLRMIVPLMRVLQFLQCCGL